MADLNVEQDVATERRRRAMHEADQRIARLRAGLDMSRLTATGGQMVREARDEYARSPDDLEPGR